MINNDLWWLRPSWLTTSRFQTYWPKERLHYSYTDSAELISLKRLMVGLKRLQRPTMSCTIHVCVCVRARLVFIYLYCCRSCMSWINCDGSGVIQMNYHVFAAMFLCSACNSRWPAGIKKNTADRLFVWKRIVADRMPVSRHAWTGLPRMKARCTRLSAENQ